MKQLLIIFIIIFVIIFIIILYNNYNKDKDEYKDEYKKNKIYLPSTKYPDDTFIIYAYYNKGGDDSRENKNLKFLLKNGNLNPNNILIICHNNIIPEFIPTNIKVLKKENHGYDFEAWYYGINYIDRNLYKKFIFINSSCIGPFIPLWFHNLNIHWTTCITNMLSEKVKLVGCTVNDDISEHIQSYFWCTDNIGLNILLENKILSKNNYNFQNTIINLEVGMSKLIKEKGYEIKGIAMNNMLNDNTHDIHFNNKYYGTTINPLEIIFYKNNRINTKITKLYIKCYDNVIYV